MSRIVPAANLDALPQLIGLAAAMDLISFVRDPESGKHYYGGADPRSRKPFLYKKTFELAHERAKLLSVLLQFEDAVRLISLAESA